MVSKMKSACFLNYSFNQQLSTSMFILSVGISHSPFAGPEEGVTQALFYCGSVFGFCVDHPLNEILCHHIFNMVQRVLSFVNVGLTFEVVTKRMASPREDIVAEHPCHL